MQNNKADVKAIMARFQASGSSTDETSTTTAGRIKQPVHSTLSSGPPVQTKKPVLESLSGNVPPKPSFLKKEVSTKSDTEAQEPNKAKALANRFANTQDDANLSSKPFSPNKQIPLKPPFSLTPESKGPVQKPHLSKPSISNNLSDSKPAFPKIPPSAIPKSNWMKEDSGVGAPSSTTSTPKMPSLQQKPSSSVLKLRQQNEELPGSNTDSPNKAPPLANSTLKPASNFKLAQSMFNKDDKNEQSDSGVSNNNTTAINAIPPPKPPSAKKPSLKKPPKPSFQDSNFNDNAPSWLKRNPLPNSLALGPAPAKPNRPPKVNLENIKIGAVAADDGKINLN